MEFVVFSQAKKLGKDQVVGVDCFLPGRLNLSHWRGAGPPASVAAETSAATVLNALEAGEVPGSLRYVTNNHFDVDGFVGVWALLNPGLALKHKQLLSAMALLGDFRELPRENELAQRTLKLVAWLNTVEKEKFYAPFGRAFKEEAACVPKYNYFLSTFETVLQDPELFRSVWEEEVSLVNEHVSLADRNGSLTFHDDIRLLVVRTPRPLHYYALFGQTAEADMVLSVYPGNKYELEYKYTTWVDAYGRKSFPRIDMKSLADRLNKLERGGAYWTGTDITDTGPILRPGPSIKDKAIRFDHPCNRPFYPSSIPAGQLEEVVADFFRSAYHHITPKEIWTWEEIRNVNRQLAAKGI